MKLFQVMVTHYSPKDSHTAVEAYILADDEEQAIPWLAAHCGAPDEDDEDSSVYPADDWWKAHPDEAARAKAMGLTVVNCDWGDREGQPEYVEGDATKLWLWWRGNYGDPEDLYYGATHYSWGEGRPVTKMDVAVLLSLNIATLCRAEVKP